MKKIAITVKEAYRIAKELGINITQDNNRTYFATNEKRTELWEFDTKKERDDFIIKR